MLQPSTPTNRCVVIFIMACSAILCGVLLPLGTGCLRSGDREVIVYTALDRAFSEPIFREFTQKTGIQIRAKYDSESTKTVQLVTDIIAEQGRPRCDLFWNNEILNTLRLDHLGLLATYRPHAAAEYPETFRSSSGRWHGLAARARVLLVNTEVVPTSEMPESIFDLVASKWQGKVGIAKPLFGTTATHAVCLFQSLGEKKATTYFKKLADSAQILSGNKQVAVAVSRGQLAFGLTDTDDAIIEIERGFPVQIVYPDQGDGQIGTLFIPNTLALLRGSPNHALARELADYLLSATVEEKLARGPSAQIPLHKNLHIELRVETPNTIRPMKVDFEAAARNWQDVGKFLEQQFAAAN